MECQSIEKFENDVFELSPIEISRPLYAHTSLAPNEYAFVYGVVCVKGNMFIYFFCLRLIIVCASCVVWLLFPTIRNIYVEHKRIKRSCYTKVHKHLSMSWALVLFH